MFVPCARSRIHILSPTVPLPWPKGRRQERLRFVRKKKEGKKSQKQDNVKKKRFVRINATSQEDSKAQHRRGISHQTYLCTVYFAGPPFSVFSTFFFRNNRNTSGGRSMATVTLTCATAVRQEYERNVIQAVAAAAAAAVLVAVSYTHLTLPTILLV